MDPELFSEKSGIRGPLAPVYDAVPDLRELAASGKVAHHLAVMGFMESAPGLEQASPEPLGRGAEFASQDLQRLFRVATAGFADPLLECLGQGIHGWSAGKSTGWDSD
jgi:hypothetical protein